MRSSWRFGRNKRTARWSPILCCLHPAPFRDEERGRLGRFPQGLQLDIFVEAVHRRPAGAEAQARNVVVESVEPGVGKRGEREVLDGAAIDLGVGLAERRL